MTMTKICIYAIEAAVGLVALSCMAAFFLFLLLVLP
jgi:hypothetical protein